MARELFEFNTPDPVSSLGRRPMTPYKVGYIPPYVGDRPVIQHPWVKWPGRGVICVQRGAMNLVRSPDMNNNNIWTHNGAYHYLPENRWDDDLQKECWFWWRGSQTTQTYIYDYGAGVSPYSTFPAGDYGSSIWIKTKVATQVLSYIYSGVGASSYVEVPANTWTLVTNRWTTTGAGTGFGWRINPAVGTYSSGDWFMAADPMIHNDFSSPVFGYPGYTKDMLPFSTILPERFSFSFWYRPLFDREIGVSPYQFSWGPLSTSCCRLYYNQGYYNFAMAWRNGGTVAYNSTTTFSAAELDQWMFICGYVDVTSQYGTWFKVKTPTYEKAAVDWDSAVDTWTDGIAPLRIMGRYDDSSANCGHGLMTDLMIARNEEITEEEFDEHFYSDMPYIPKNRILGENCGFRLDEFGNLAVRNMGSVG